LLDAAETLASDSAIKRRFVVLRRPKYQDITFERG
jgi:hypothetical protein